MAKLKVFRTPIGFDDAYVAVTSQRAALKAWGNDSNLFATGEAEQVTDPALIEEPLRHPGEVIRVARGTQADHLKTLGPAPAPRSPRRRSNPPAETSPARRAHAKPGAAPKPAARTKPMPSRKALDDAEAAIVAAEADLNAKAKDIRREEEALKQQRRDLEADFEVTMGKLRARRDAARADFQRRIASWAAE